MASFDVAKEMARLRQQLNDIQSKKKNKDLLVQQRQALMEEIDEFKHLIQQREKQVAMLDTEITNMVAPLRCHHYAQQAQKVEDEITNIFLPDDGFSYSMHPHNPLYGYRIIYYQYKETPFLFVKSPTHFEVMGVRYPTWQEAYQVFEKIDDSSIRAEIARVQALMDKAASLRRAQFDANLVL